MVNDRWTRSQAKATLMAIVPKSMNKFNILILFDVAASNRSRHGILRGARGQSFNPSSAVIRRQHTLICSVETT